MIGPAPSPLYPTAPAAKEPYVHTLFDQLSPRYDLFNRLASLGLDQQWRRRALARAQLKPGMRVLDLGAGTGDFALAAAESVCPTGMVAAFDLSVPMLRQTQRKADERPAGYHVRPVNGRAEQLPLADGAVDAVVSGFVMRNVSDIPQTLSESRRVLRDGGRLVILEFSRPRGRLLRLGHTLWLSTGMLVLGWLAAGARWPFAYLRRSIAEFVPPTTFVAALRTAGFCDVTMTPLLGGAVMIYAGVKR